MTVGIYFGSLRYLISLYSSLYFTVTVLFMGSLKTRKYKRQTKYKNISKVECIIKQISAYSCVNIHKNLKLRNYLEIIASNRKYIGK